MLTSATDGSCLPLSFDLDKVTGNKKEIYTNYSTHEAPKTDGFCEGFQEVKRCLEMISSRRVAVRQGHNRW